MIRIVTAYKGPHIWTYTENKNAEIPVWFKSDTLGYTWEPSNHQSLSKCLARVGITMGWTVISDVTHYPTGFGNISTINTAVSIPQTERITINGKNINELPVEIPIISEGNKTKHKCNCEWDSLLAYGCKCGGI